MRSKLTSRKFWVCVAAALASIGTSIAGIATKSSSVAVAGAVCTVISSAIYAFCEAWVDSNAIGKSETEDFPVYDLDVEVETGND